MCDSGTSVAPWDSLINDMTAYQMTAAGVLIAALTGVPSGWFIWARTHSRMTALTTGLAIGAVAVVVTAWLYYTRVLCPPGAGCV